MNHLDAKRLGGFFVLTNDIYQRMKTSISNNTDMQLLIDVPTQQLYCMRNDQLLKSYQISTAANGVGEKRNSGQTPRGWHVIRAKIGNNQPINTVFVGRRPTGEIFTTELSKQFPDRDWILTRILWLSGLEIGKNRLGECDTMQRYIYIHGTPDGKQMGVAGSKGCIRMRNEEMIELFDSIIVGTKVFIRG